MKVKSLEDWHTISGRSECCKRWEHDICFDLCENGNGMVLWQLWLQLQHYYLNHRMVSLLSPPHSKG